MKNVAIMGKQSVRQTAGGASITEEKRIKSIDQSINQSIYLQVMAV